MLNRQTARAPPPPLCNSTKLCCRCLGRNLATETGLACLDGQGTYPVERWFRLHESLSCPADLPPQLGNLRGPRRLGILLANVGITEVLLGHFVVLGEATDIACGHAAVANPNRPPSSRAGPARLAEAVRPPH